MAEWFESWFGDCYLEVYPNRDDAEATMQVESLLARTTTPTTGPVLDIACGSGRHLQALRNRGLSTFGIDLSETLLRQAQKRQSVSGTIARADMRSLPFKSNSFALALSMFTSFGYFENKEHHLILLSECQRVLKPAGVFVLDYLNSKQVVANLIPNSQRETTNLRIEEQRRIIGNGDRIEKIITVTRKQSGETKKYRESVALFSHLQLAELLKLSGFHVTEIIGDFDGRAFDDDAPRCIVLSESII